MKEVDLLHELCHAKLNEIGFKKVEVTMEQAALNRDSHQEQEEFKKAILLSAEAYANFLLFRYFKQESRLLMMKLDQRLLVAKSIRILVQELGFKAVALAVMHRITKRWNGYNEDDAFKWAFEQAFKGKYQLRFYTEIHSIMSKLPIIKEVDGQIQNLTSADIDTIEKCVLELFKNFDAWRLHNK